VHCNTTKVSIIFFCFNLPFPRPIAPSSLRILQSCYKAGVKHSEILNPITAIHKQVALHLNEANHHKFQNVENFMTQNNDN
jgi:hypothetical protein